MTRVPSCALVAMCLVAGWAPPARTVDQSAEGDPDGDVVVLTGATGWVEGRVRDPSRWWKPAVVAAGAAGAAVVVTGGGTAPSSTVPPGSTSTTTTTTTSTATTTTQPACVYDIAGRSDPPLLPAGGGAGTCLVRTDQACDWSARTSADWISLVTAAGRGDGAARFVTAPNAGPARSTRIVLREGGGSCLVEQDEGPARLVPEESVTWQGHLELAGGQVQVTWNGRVVAQHGSGRVQGHLPADRAHHRVEAELVAASGRAGWWRLDVLGPVRPGSLRVVAGDVLSLEPAAAVVRFGGRAGERVVIEFETSVR